MAVPALNQRLVNASSLLINIGDTVDQRTLWARMTSDIRSDQLTPFFKHLFCQHYLDHLLLNKIITNVYIQYELNSAPLSDYLTTTCSNGETMYEYNLYRIIYPMKFNFNGLDRFLAGQNYFA